MIVKLHTSPRGRCLIFGGTHNDCVRIAQAVESGDPAQVTVAAQMAVWTDERPEQFRAAVLAIFNIETKGHHEQTPPA